MARRDKSERGANLVEFALVAPFLILLLFGIIEFAWVLAQNLNIRHGAREAARLAAVDHSPLSDVCDRMDIVSGATITFSGSDLNLDSTFGPGDEVAAAATAPVQPITGMFNAWLPANLTSTVSIRVEQPTTGWTTPVNCP